MANTLTNLIPELYAGLDTVSRELVGFIPAVGRNSTAERAAVNEAVRYHIAPTGTSGNTTPAMTIPEPTDQTIGSGTISITKSKNAEFGFTGEEQMGLNNGPGHMSVQADMFAQALRILTNEIEDDIASAAYIAASRATGTQGTTPFASGVGDTAQLRKILADNGAPMGDNQLVIDTTAGAILRTNTQLTKANEANDSTMLRQGVLLDLHGFAVGESAGVQSHTAGTVSTNITVTGVEAIGSTAIGVTTDATGDATLVAGDIVQFAGDSNEYVVASAVTIGNSTTGTITIAEPGLRVATAGTEVVTAGASYTGNIGFHRNAIQLVTRAPARPIEGDAALDSIMLVDPRSGLAFEVSTYPGYRKVRYEVALAWGTAVVQPRHTALLLG